MGGKIGLGVVVLPMLLAGLAAPTIGWSADGSDARDLSQIRREISQLKADKTRTDNELRNLKEEKAHDDQVIQDLERKVDAIASQGQKLQADTTQKLGTLEQKVAAGPSPSQFNGIFGRYLGSHTFLVTGAAGLDFAYDQQSGALDGIPHASQNTFTFDWEPMVLYRPADWILFEGVFSGSAGATGTGTDLSTGEFQLFVNDYLTVVGGLFDQPFGDWYENQSPMWVNRFITAPLPFGNEPVVPPGELGLQARGGLQWGQPGQDFDYTLWAGDGVGFSEPVPGAAMSSPTFGGFSQTNGKSLGARLRIYPIPVDADIGRLELGASTYNGKWLNGLWFNSWGVDFNYFNGNLRTRGEWLQSYRQMPTAFSSDNRQGWYLQASYMLAGLHPSFLPAEIRPYFQRLEPLIRYSGVNQHAVAIDDITGAVAPNGIGIGPDFGTSGSPALFAPHSREVALALDYWFAPSIVWQNEFDIELPRAGGLFYAADGTFKPAGHIPNDHAFLTQFTVGF